MYNSFFLYYNFGIEFWFRFGFDSVSVKFRFGRSLKIIYSFLATFMGYLNQVEAGGATAFCKPFKEEIIKPQKGSVTFWYSLDTKGHRLPEALHGGCPVLKGSKWIFNKWIHYFDQWKNFPCGLKEFDVFDPPKFHY